MTQANFFHDRSGLLFPFAFDYKMWTDIEGTMMKHSAFLASLIALSASAFAADCPVLRHAQPEDVGFNTTKLNNLDR